MKRLSLIALLVLNSCFYASNDSLVMQGMSPKKQKQRIAFLQKKLEVAEKEQKKCAEEVERISTEIDEVQLSLIRKQVDDYERKNEKSVRFFLEEREALYRMIQAGPSPASLEAQVELDRILRIITELSDTSKNA